MQACVKRTGRKTLTREQPFLPSLAGKPFWSTVWDFPVLQSHLACHAQALHEFVQIFLDSLVVLVSTNSCGKLFARWIANSCKSTYFDQF